MPNAPTAGRHLCFLTRGQPLPLEIRTCLDFILGTQLAVLDLRLFSDPDIVAEDCVFDFSTEDEER